MKMFSDMKSPCELKEVKTAKSNKWLSNLLSVGTVAEIACHLRHLIGPAMLVCSSNFLCMSLALFHSVAHVHWCWFSIAKAYCFPVQCNYSFLSTKRNRQYGGWHKKTNLHRKKIIRSRRQETNRVKGLMLISYHCAFCVYLQDMIRLNTIEILFVHFKL